MGEKRKYLIVAPHFDRRSAGIKALYVLTNKLNNLGYDAYITSNPRDSGYFCKNLYSLNKEQLKDLQLNGIVVYPEGISGNPLQFTNIVRWFLGATYPPVEHELSFSFNPYHNTFAETKDNLMMFDIESFFKPPEIENRIKKCFRIGKGGGGPAQEITNDCIEITSFYPNTRQELANLFQQSTVLYSYDYFTLLLVEALFCGCPVVLIGCPPPVQIETKNNILYRYGLGFYDDMFNMDSLEKLKEEIPLQLEIYKELLTITFPKELENFITLTQNMPSIYIENLGIHTPSNPHPWVTAGFWPDFFSLFRTR